MTLSQIVRGGHSYMLTNKEIRSTAREYLRGNYKMAVVNLILITIANSVMQSVVRTLTGESALNMQMTGETLPNWDSVFSMQSSPFQTTLNVVLSIIVALIIGSMQMGNEWGYLDMLDGTPLSSGHLLKPFENQLFKTLGVLVLQAVYVILWSVLLIIPGIMKLYAFALSNFIYFDNPDMKTTDILRQSEAFMKGKKMRLFQLDLTYFVVYLIPVVLFFGVGIAAFNIYAGATTADSDALLYQALLLVGLMLAAFAIFGILTFIVEPRRKAARAVFYSEVLKEENLIIG